MGEQLEKTIEVVAELREVLTEGRALLKDLRHEKKELSRLLEDAKYSVEETAGKNVAAILEQAVEIGLEKYASTIAEAQEIGIQKILGTFDELANSLLYGDKRGRGKFVFDDLGIPDPKKDN